jgi:hypothetical protein
MGTPFYPGKPTIVAGDSATSSFSGVLEDDGTTAYFYAFDRAAKSNPILDAVHIYAVESVSDRERKSEAEIVWSTDGFKCGLLINGYLHAVLDFQARRLIAAAISRRQ